MRLWAYGPVVMFANHSLFDAMQCEDSHNELVPRIVGVTVWLLDIFIHFRWYLFDPVSSPSRDPTELLVLRWIWAFCSKWPWKAAWLGTVQFQKRWDPDRCISTYAVINRCIYCQWMYCSILKKFLLINNVWNFSFSFRPMFAVIFDNFRRSHCPVICWKTSAQSRQPQKCLISSRHCVIFGFFGSCDFAQDPRDLPSTTSLNLSLSAISRFIHSRPISIPSSFEPCCLFGFGFSELRALPGSLISSTPKPSRELSTGAVGAVTFPADSTLRLSAFQRHHGEAKGKSQEGAAPCGSL